MGMDVFGLEPTSEEGKYFRRNVWGWRPLAQLCLALAPQECKPCTHWGSNDGDGLNGKQAKRLALKLQCFLENGTVATYIAERNAWVAALPRETCKICQGTGIRDDALGRRSGDDKRKIDDPAHPRYGQTGWCNGCDGRGDEPAWDSHYSVTEDCVKEFAAFLMASGGFEIW